MSHAKYTGTQSKLRFRLGSYFRKILSRMTWYHVQPLVLARRLGVSERSIWYAVHELRDTSCPEFKIEKRRVGSCYVTIVSLAQVPECKSMTIEQGLSNERNEMHSTGKPERLKSAASTARVERVVANPARERRKDRLAHFITRRHLRLKHWDNCKVRWCYGNTFNYVRNALGQGFRDWAIAKAYQMALEALHKVATDVGLNTGTPDLMFEPSKLKAHAIEILKRSDKSEVIWAPTRYAFGAA